MKAKPYFLINHEVKDLLIKEIIDLPVGEDYKVTISKSGTKSQRQRGLDYKWDGEINKSGIGWHDDTIEETHARGKWMFARPILLTDDELFTAIHDHFMAMYGKDKGKCLEFARDYISTESMTTSQVAEYMTDKQRYWTGKGVDLTNPDDYGIKLHD